MTPSPAIEPALNQILFGPPGTGKTYATINQTLAILAPEFLAKNSGNDPDTRKRLKKAFDQFVTADRVRFVTFHQSFSYEDFVEGIRADSDGETGQLKYPIEAGVFKRICDDARTQPATDLGVRANPAIWKISIDGTGASPSKSYCLTNGEARIGWGKTGDLREDYEQSPYYQGLGAGDKGTLNYFAEQMAVGDILLCIHSAEQVGSIGVVTSEYRYEKQVPAGMIANYQHVRSVRWLYRDINLSILPLNDGRQFTLKTVYAMSRFTWADLLSFLHQQGVQPAESTVVAATTDEPYVLIIDEINRGNVSRIFGELITLIEPSKREGADEALSLKLPYSKKPFSVPKNVYLIGTMNTADRSLAGLDIALRRRFTFKEMLPQPQLLDGVSVAGVNIGQLLRVMNERIEVLLDREHCLGHAYFMPLLKASNLAQLELIFRNQLIQAALSLKPREVSVAGLELFNAPLTEWVMGQFLGELDLLVKRGIRFDYKRVEEDQRFLRGQLNVVAQIRQPPGRQHHFQVRHDVFLPDRAENRLLKLALEHVAKSTDDAANWRLASELRTILAEVPASRQPDLLIDTPEARWILDAKWKRVDMRKPKKNYDLSQSIDFARSVEGMVLVDGIRLVNLMMDHEVGVASRLLKLPKLDSDNFDEE
eukprot:gene1973-1937_t